MASKRVIVPAKHLFNGFGAYQNVPPRLRPHLARSMATEASMASSNDAISAASSSSSPIPSPPSGLGASISTTRADTQKPTSPMTRQPVQNPFLTSAQCILHDFPSLEPTGLHIYPSTHLLLPLRKDILHRAVIFEGDNTRQGTANTKWRSEVHGSGRKIRPQKGTGSARLGDKKSPMLRGGGVAFGPKPRDFSTDLPKKVYDLAWRMALSYRYKMGEITVVNSEISLNHVLNKGSRERYFTELLARNRFYKGGALFITDQRRSSLFDTVESERIIGHAKALTMDDVDVKDLLKVAHLVIEKKALDRIFLAHQYDLPVHQRLKSADVIGKHVAMVD